MPKDLGLFYVSLPTVTLYIQWEQFIIFQFTLPTPSHQVPSNFMLDFKTLGLNLLNILTLSTLKFVLGDHPTRLKKILTISKQKFFRVNSHRDRNIVVTNFFTLSKQNTSKLIHQNFVHVYITRLKKMSRKGVMEGLPENLSDLE